MLVSVLHLPDILVGMEEEVPTPCLPMQQSPIKCQCLQREQ